MTIQQSNQISTSCIAGIGVNKQHTPTRIDICAIVITYHPDGDLSERLNRIIDQVGGFIIVDNHSSEVCLKMIKMLSTQMKINLIVNKENVGIATALNQGISYAIKCGYNWALTLDQDTIPYATMVQNLLTAYYDCQFKERVGIIGTNFQERKTGKELLSIKNREKRSWLEISEVITSGSLVSLQIFEEAGPFRDDFFIDLVDFEYCLRLRYMGYKVIVTSEVGMIQSYGDCKMKKFIWVNKVVRNYPPLRSYYRTRNALTMIREYFWREPRWVLYRLLTIILIRPLSIILFEDNKTLKVKYILLGIYHSLLSKQGKLK